MKRTHEDDRRPHPPHYADRPYENMPSVTSRAWGPADPHEDRFGYAGIGGYGDWDPVPPEVMEEVAYRTPGFSGWQQEQWWTHCGDAGMFVGRAGREEVEEAGEDAVAAIRASAGIEDDDEWEEYFDALDKDASPTAYLFKCSKCGKYGGYQDSD